jgi:hypothetical protein
MKTNQKSISAVFSIIFFCVTIERVTSFTAFTPEILKKHDRQINLQNQHAKIHRNSVPQPTTTGRFTKGPVVDLFIPSTTQLSMLSIRNVIATALHHDPNDHHVMMAGSIWPILKKLFTAPMKLRLIIHNIVSITEWQECILLPLLAFGLTPLAKLYYRASCSNERPMHDMKRFGIVALIDQISKVALSVYAMDVISITLTTIGFTFAKEWRIAEVYAKFACTYSLLGTSELLKLLFIHFWM